MFEKILITLDAISPFLLLLLLYQKRFRIIERGNPVFYFIIVQFIANMICNWMDLKLGKNNILIYFINCVLSFLILSIYFFQKFSFSHKWIIMSTIFLSFMLFSILDLIYWEKLITFNSNVFTVASFVITIYGLLYYYDQLIQPVPVSLKKSRDFWFVTGLFTYYASSFFIFATYKILTRNFTKNMGILWQIHNIIFLIMCVYLFIGFLCNPSQKSK